MTSTVIDIKVSIKIPKIPAFIIQKKSFLIKIRLAINILYCSLVFYKATFPVHSREEGAVHKTFTYACQARSAFNNNWQPALNIIYIL